MSATPALTELNHGSKAATERPNRGRAAGVVERTLLTVLIGAAFVAVLLTAWSVRSGLSPTGDLSQIIRMLWIDLALLSLIAGFVLRRLFLGWRVARRHADSRNSLLIRVTLLFSVVAVVPTILVSVSSILIFNLGVQGWFSEPVETAIAEAEAVATSYLEEHRQSITIDALEMANDLNRGQRLLVQSRERFDLFVENQSWLRGLNEAIVITKAGDIEALGGMSSEINSYQPQIAQTAYQQAETGDVVLLSEGPQDRVQALIQLQNYDNAFLYITKLVDSAVVSRVRKTENAAATYNNLRASTDSFQAAFLMIFAVIGILLLLTALVFAFYFATSLSGPILSLIRAANRLGEGDLSARVDAESREFPEIQTLTTTFNRMAGRLSEQQRDLIEANDQLDDRRKFTEAVLSGVSAGVIGLERDGTINLPNRRASVLLGRSLSDRQYQALSDVVPEMSDTFSRLSDALLSAENASKMLQDEVVIRVGDSLRTFHVTLVLENENNEGGGFILTFDDMSDLQSAQRQAAWSDVAQRIAHEIKNPLTPIQLSAERLKRRYGKQINQDDRAIFDVCTDTIIRQVNDIGRMVTEFSNFAKTPTPEVAEENLTDILSQAAFLQRNADTSIEVETTIPEGPYNIACDGRLISQSVINILKNAGEAIETRRLTEPEHTGIIRLTLLNRESGKPSVYIQDNGCGIPDALKGRLTEPYVTTRQKGTGLGLAIVKKIMEDHAGMLVVDGELPPELKDERFDGATFELRFE